MNDLIARILDETNAAANPYFDALRKKEFSKPDFVETQIQFHFAVVFFSRPMAALAARIPTAERRMEVLRNVWEEHGEGDVGLSHGSTFREFLRRLDDVDDTDLASRALWPEVRAFNTTLVGACVLDEWLVAAAMMGMIERMFAEISGWIGSGVVENGWIPAERMTHYSVHEKLDVKHADDFFDVLRPSWDEGPQERYWIEQGLRLGATVFHGLYDGLWRSRGRRLHCDALRVRST